MICKRHDMAMCSRTAQPGSLQGHAPRPSAVHQLSSRLPARPQPAVVRLLSSRPTALGGTFCTLHNAAFEASAAADPRPPLKHVAAGTQPPLCCFTGSESDNKSAGIVREEEPEE